ncbi:MAG: 16S rRNA (guanine(966)-N(2))-methyltransferase RsmD [Flavobacteriales bacterium]|nr:16S rRNA (guanine(966)-N(2))-methyltransferase RsmD [Flavobacteriales bacterium]|tara:strand:- start:815 stop:1339 length:525 start_codon:yes stop_codon:yes gene_type:complete
MRIISGTHKGRKINPPNNLLIRPTTDRAKEAIFSIIESRYFFTKKTTLDLFSGSGNISLEFASRGCNKIKAIDHNFDCVRFINNISKEFKFNISAVQSEVLKYVENCNEQYNFIFADPPYKYKNYEELKDIIIKKRIVKKDGLLIIEHDKTTIFNDLNVEVRKYGTSHFSLFSF